MENSQAISGRFSMMIAGTEIRVIYAGDYRVARKDQGLGDELTWSALASALGSQFPVRRIHFIQAPRKAASDALDMDQLLPAVAHEVESGIQKHILDAVQARPILPTRF